MCSNWSFGVDRSFRDEWPGVALGVWSVSTASTGISKLASTATHLIREISHRGGQCPVSGLLASGSPQNKCCHCGSRGWTGEHMDLVKLDDQVQSQLCRSLAVHSWNRLLNLSVSQFLCGWKGHDSTSRRVVGGVNRFRV